MFKLRCFNKIFQYYLEALQLKFFVDLLLHFKERNIIYTSRLNNRMHSKFAFKSICTNAAHWLRKIHILEGNYLLRVTSSESPHLIPIYYIF
jgi:hypothetical protein